MTREEFNAKLLPFLRDDLTVEQHIEVVEMREKLLAAERERCADLAEFDYKHANSLTIARAIRGLRWKARARRAE